MKRHLLLPLLLLLPACTQYQPSSPELHLSPDLRTIAFFPSTSFGDSPRAIQTIDRGTGTGVLHPIPIFHAAYKIFFFDNRLFTFTSNNGGDFILDEGQWHNVDAPISTIWYPPFTGQYQGQPAIFSSAYHTDIYSLKDFTNIGHLDYPVRGIGDGYMLRYTWPDGPRTLRSPALTAIDLLDPDLKPIMHLTLPTDADAAQLFTDAEAQISPDHKLLMLAPDRPSGGRGARGPDSIASLHFAGYAVYEIPTGNLLFCTPLFPHRTSPRDPTAMHGTPVASATLADDGVYTIEETIPLDPAATNPALPRRKPTSADRQFWLARYTAEGRQLIVQLPIPPRMSIFPTFTTAASAAGRLMVIHTLTPKPHLLEVPLKPDATEKDIRYFNLP